MLARKKYKDDLVKLAKAVVVATALVRKLSKAPSGEKGPDTAERLQNSGGCKNRAHKG
jgi:hypothetical protein